VNAKTSAFRTGNILLALSMVLAVAAISGCSQSKPEIKVEQDPRGFPKVPDLSKPTPKYLNLRKSGENYFDQLKQRPKTLDSDFAFQADAKKPQMSVTSKGVKYQDVEEGFGLIPKDGGVTMIHYTGWLGDGTEFDSSLKRGPHQFKWGKNEVLIGLEDGMQGMKVGGTRVIVIPPNLAYGKNGFDKLKIPPNATLTYKVKLLSAGKG